MPTLLEELLLVPEITPQIVSGTPQTGREVLFLSHLLFTIDG